MKLNRISKLESYKDKAYHEIKEAIIKQKLSSGDPINERTLAEELGISRTPIREALSLLAKEGWIVSEPCRGTWVKEITPKDITEIYQMRLALEELAVELIVNRLDERLKSELAELRTEQQSLDDELDIETFTDLDMNFHLFLAQSSDNTRLYHTMNSFMSIMNMFLLRTIRTAQPTIIPREEHVEILSAILEKNIPRAKKAVRSHMRKALKKATETLGAKRK